MAINFHKIRNGIVIKPVTAPITGEIGDIYYDSSLNEFQFNQNGVLISLPSAVSPTSPAAGGTGLSNPTAHGILIGEGSSNVNPLVGSTGTLLQGNGSSVDPSFTAIPTLGVNGTTQGILNLATSTASGASISLQNGGATTAYNFNLPTTVGRGGQLLNSAAGGSAAMTWSEKSVKNYMQVYTASTSSGTANVGNGNFVLGNTTGWSLGTTGTLTNGLPTGSPTFGSGASGNLSISTVTGGSQISGSYSMSYASSTATTQGNMLASNPFYIDTEDQAKILTVKFYYSVATGASAGNFSGTSSNSFGWAVWDVTNSAWLGVTGQFGMTQSTGVGYVTGTFQTAINTTELRFVLYNANASSGAITLYLDDFFVGPAPNNTGIISTPNTFTVLTATSGTYTPPSGVYQIKVQMVGGGSGGGASANSGNVSSSPGTSSTFGTLTAGGATATSGPNGGAGGSASGGTLNLIGGTGGDSSNFVTETGGGMGAASPFGGAGGNGCTNGAGQNAAARTGSGGGGGGGSSTSPLNTGAPGGGAGGYVEAILSPSTYTYTVGTGGAGASAGTNGFAGGNGAAGIIIVEEFYYGLNVNMSSDTDTRVVAFNSTVNGTASGTISTSATQDIIILPGAALDTHAGYNATTGLYTVPVSGDYQVFANITINGTGITAGQITLQHNGSSYALSAPFQASATRITLVVSAIVPCSAGDTLGIYNSELTGSSLTYLTNASVLSINRLSGPAVIAATESVNATYTNSSGQSITNSGAIVQLTGWTKSFDTHNAFNSSTNNYVVPVSGKYQVTLMTSSAVVAWTAGNTWDNHIQQNGSDVALSPIFIAGTVTIQANATTTIIISCNAGDLIGFYNSNNRSGGATALNASAIQNYFSIARVGN